MNTLRTQIPAWAAAAVTLLTCAAWPALAQTAAQPTNEQLFQSFLASPAYANFIEQALAGTEPAPFKAECTRLTVVDQPRFAIVRPAAFSVTNGQGAIVDGVWVAFLPVDRCGTKAIRRLLVVVAGPNNLTPSRLLPGDFRGDLRLEADVQRTVLPVLMEVAECQDEKNVFVGDIKTLSATPTAWSEQWFASACGKPASMLVHYTRNGNSIDYTTELPPQAGQPPGPFQIVPQAAPPALNLRPTPLPTRPGAPVAK